ncbi:MAG: sigma-70 family RNA polymerase sigma factor [Mucilaginibacter sp.]
MTSEELHIALQRIALEGDQCSFKKIYIAYYDRLYKLSLSIVKSEQLAEEVYNDVMMNIWGMRQRLLGINNFSVYLYVAIKNVSQRYLAQIRYAEKIDINNIEIRDFSPTIQEQMVSRELIDGIKHTINQLSPQCQIVFKMVKEDGLKYREVAEILNMSIKNVEYHVGGALRKISQQIACNTANDKLYTLNAN